MQLNHVFSLILGILCGVAVHFTIYRVSIPLQPIIYQSF
jgi:hypothetical protein